MYIGLHVKYRYSCRILMKIEFSRQILKNTKISNFVKIRPVGAELFHADRLTHGEANCRFSQFCEKRLKKVRSHPET